jgi:formamidase
VPLIVAKSGKHCKDDPNCFNRIHYAVKPVARVKPGQQFILETRDGLDSEFTFDSTAADVAAVNLNLCHPLTGPVYIEGAKRGDSIAVTVVDIAPDDFATIFLGLVLILAGFGTWASRDRLDLPCQAGFALSFTQASERFQ